MATMASTHSLSVLTNASVKAPVNPKTGLSASLHERPGPNFASFSGVFFDDYNENGRTGKEILDPKSTRKFTSDATSILQLSNLSDEDFYAKLLELKSEQRKVLQKCEQIYIEKHNGQVVPTFSDKSEVILTKEQLEKQFSTRSVIKNEKTYRSKVDTVRSETFVDDDGVLVSTRKTNRSPERAESPLERTEKSLVEDVLSPEATMDTNTKPPTGRPPLSQSLASPMHRPRSAPMAREIARSLDDLRNSVNQLRKSFDVSDEEEDYVPDDTVSEPYREHEKYQRFEDMWQNFSIDEYAPRHSRGRERPSSATFTRKEKKQKDDSWRHRLTIPRPFTMTLRDESKEKRKSRNMMEFEEQKYRKEIEEEEEMKKKFKARPVPAHVYLPLYDEIKEKDEEKRRHIRQTSLDLLKSQERPFSFSKRELDRKAHQQMERECSQKPESSTPVTRKSQTFKAKPVPKAIFDEAVDEKLMEEEEYRKIRIKMRAEEMLRTADLPPNMKAREHLKEQQLREQKMKSKKKSKSAARPRINHDVPNYDALYRQFQQELQRRKGMKESTVSHPFQLETQRTSKSARDRMKKEIEKQENFSQTENRWPYKMSTRKIKLGHMTSSLDALPAKSTRSADCRNSKTKKFLRELSARELAEIEEDRRRRVREMKLRREIQDKTRYGESPREKPEDRIRQNREAERQRMEEYERELQDMKQRVQQRPLLFEQETQVNAKKKAEKKFNATLRSVGLDEDFVHSRGSRSASMGPTDYSDDNYDDDEFEDTAVKHTDETYTRDRRESSDEERPLSPEEA